LEKSTTSLLCSFPEEDDCNLSFESKFKNEKMENQLVVILGNSQFNIHKNRLLDFKEAENIYRELSMLLAEESK
jgi:hypothetical protein